MIPRERELECAREIVDFQRQLKLKIDARRASPTDDLLSDVVNARLDGETRSMTPRSCRLRSS